MFAGWFTREAADAVCGEGTPGGPSEDVLATLTDKSMVVVDVTDDTTRFRLLETLREYGRARLAESDGVEAARRHAEYFVTLAEAVAEQLRGPDEAVAVASLDVELDDLRAAHRWLIENHKLDLSLRLAAALHWYALWRMRSEISSWAEQAIEQPRARAHPSFPEACASAGVGAWMRGDLRRAADLAHRAIETAGPSCHPPRPTSHLG